MSKTYRTEAQKRFLQRRAIKMKEEETGCDCPGDCGFTGCKGHTRNCRCDWDLSFISQRRDTEQLPITSSPSDDKIPF